MPTFGDEATVLRSAPYLGIIRFVFHAVIFFMSSIAKSASLERTLALEGFMDIRCKRGKDHCCPF